MTVDYSVFDYCLLEHIDNQNTVISDLVSLAEGLGCPVGIAHTDMFAYCEKKGLDPLSFFTALAEHHIFWEMNVNYDSIHGYREHKYVTEFLQNEEQQHIVKASGIRLSVGFDGHKVEDYLPQRVIRMNEFLQDKGIERIMLN